MKRALAMLLACLFCLLSLSACTPERDAGEGYTFKDDTGASVTLTETPRRVAVLFSSYAEMWTLAGGEVAVTVGESVERGFAAADTPLVDAGAGKSISHELLLAAAPDFVILSADIAAQADTATLLRSAGIPTAAFRVESFADYARVMRIFADITGDEDAYHANVSEVGARIEEILASVPAERDTRILFIRCGSKYSATKAKRASDHFAAAMLEELGCVNIADSAPVLLDGLSIEKIIEENPDYIFFSTMGDEEKAKEYMNGVLSEPVWQSLDAVRKGNYTYLPKESFQYKPNARWDEAYRYVRDLLYEDGATP